MIVSLTLVWPSAAERGVVPCQPPGAVGVLGRRGVGRGREVSGRIALGVGGVVLAGQVGRAERAQTVGQRVGDRRAGDVVVLGGLQRQRPCGDGAFGEGVVAGGLVDQPVLGGAREGGAVGDRLGQRSLVGAVDAGEVGQLRLVGHLGARVVVEVGRLAKRRGRWLRAGEGRRVRAQRDGGAERERLRRARGERSDVPRDERVHAERERSCAVGINVHGRDIAGVDAAAERSDDDRPRPRVLVRASGVGRRVGRVVGGRATRAAAEELETGREVVDERRSVGRVDGVVLDLQRVHGLVVVDAAEDLPLGRRLVLGHLHGGDRLGAGHGPRRPRRSARRRARRIELRHDPRVGVDERLRGDIERVADVVDGRRVADVEAQRLRGVGRQVGDVGEEQRRCAGRRLVGDLSGRDRRPARVRNAGREHDPIAEVEPEPGAQRVGRRQRDVRRRGVEHRGRRDGRRDVGRTGRRRAPGHRRAEHSDHEHYQRPGREHLGPRAARLGDGGARASRYFSPGGRIPRPCPPTNTGTKVAPPER